MVLQAPRGSNYLVGSVLRHEGENKNDGNSADEDVGCSRTSGNLITLRRESEALSLILGLLALPVGTEGDRAGNLFSFMDGTDFSP
ncbi:hypothetical protein CEXT_89361 [Caerostris extrusa]|uniref:Uncharacterized protein n=1 Tax=Caerostris extrusa TaxID=172846 RepID=A0AAV4UHC3_CAEEX|nr:hypothetical protein CEXT_89361 [Caerostris extrusa]